MRFFNTSGPCDPAKHYTVIRPALLATGQELVDQGRYFTIFAPRQAGKTTYFQLLFPQLAAAGYTPIWVSFEGLKTLTRARFYKAFAHQLQREIRRVGLALEVTLADQFDLELFAEAIKAAGHTLVLVIDEFEEIPTSVLNEVMHIFRRLYQQRGYHGLQSLVLVGVSSLAELILSSASPFNVVDELQIPYFTHAEVQELIEQYTAESSQIFDRAVVDAIYTNTAGQPGLVCALCHHLITEMVPDRSQSVTLAAFYPTLTHFLTDRFDKNIANIVQKARKKQNFMLRVLFDDNPIPFSVNEPNMAYLAAHGVIVNQGGYVDVPVPLYSKVLITAFRPLVNGESQHFVSAHDTFQDYVAGGRLNLRALLAKYRDYVHRRGFQAFDTKHLKEGAWHYSLDGFIHFFIQRLGGDTLVEIPSGRGRTDILILYRQQKYLIETKIFTDQAYFQNGKEQLADYLTTEGLTEGYYVVFSSKHSAADTLHSEEIINGKRIITDIILTNFEKPSRRRAKS